MKRYGLIGKKLSHSWSQRWFEAMFEREGILDTEYKAYELPTTNNLRRWVSDYHIDGFNVTIPYKEAVIPHLDRLDDEATAIGAVNCVEVHNGLLIGHNTDAPAFLTTLESKLSSRHKAALVLGTGGASKAVCYALQRAGIEYQLVSRTPSVHPGAIGYGQAGLLAKSYQIIINATPIGMYPNVDDTPWPYVHLLDENHLCYDLIYNPSPTRFLREAAARGAIAIGGLAMLERQAELSWTIWAKR